MDAFNILPTGRLAQGIPGDIIDVTVPYSGNTLTLTDVHTEARGYTNSYNEVLTSSTWKYQGKSYDFDNDDNWFKKSGIIYDKSFTAFRISGNSNWVMSLLDKTDSTRKNSSTIFTVRFKDGSTENMQLDVHLTLKALTSGNLTYEWTGSNSSNSFANLPITLSSVQVILPTFTIELKI